MSKPVYVEKQDDGTSKLVYVPRRMKEGKTYFVRWNGQYLALIKEGDHVNIYAGEPIEDNTKT